jgi:hypothetical protein
MYNKLANISQANAIHPAQRGQRQPHVDGIAGDGISVMGEYVTDQIRRMVQTAIRARLFGE